MTDTFDAVLRCADPSAIRDAVVSDLMCAAGAQAGNWYILWRAADSDVLVTGENRFQGPAAVAAALRAAEGQPYLPISVGETREELAAGLWAATRINDFEIQQAEELPRPLVERFWDPGDIHCSIGCNAFVDHRYAGWFGAFRTRPQPPFARELRTKLRARLPTYLGLLGTARFIEASAPEHRATLLLASDGSVLANSPQAQVWLDVPGFEARLAQELSALKPAASALSGAEMGRRFVFGKSTVDLLPLTTEGEAACVALVTPQQETDLVRYLELPQRLRDVLMLAARDRTVPEIAEQLGVAVDTVKSQIKTLYERFGIASRAELGGIAREFIDA